MRLSPPLHQRFPFVSSLIEIKLGEICQNKSVVLNDINVDIKPNEFVYLIGKTGSGKSSYAQAVVRRIKTVGGYRPH
jgi:cell division transport system ATP-binding protein